MGKDPKSKQDKKQVAAQPQKNISSTPKGIIGEFGVIEAATIEPNSKTTKSVSVNDLSMIGTLVKPEPPKAVAVDTQLKDVYRGFTLTHRHHDRTRALIFTKVLHYFEKEKVWRTILLYQPSIELSFGTEIEYQLSSFTNKHGVEEPSVINVKIVTKDTPLSRLYAWLRSDTVSESPKLEVLSIADVAASYMSKNHVGQGNEQFKNFMDSLGVFSVVGELGEGFVVKK